MKFSASTSAYDPSPRWRDLLRHRLFSRLLVIATLVTLSGCWAGQSGSPGGGSEGGFDGSEIVFAQKIERHLMLSLLDRIITEPGVDETFSELHEEHKDELFNSGAASDSGDRVHVEYDTDNISVT